MSGLQALTLDSGRLAASQPHELKFFFTVTSGAVTQLLTKDLPPIIFGTAAADFTQAAVNALLSPDAAGNDYSSTSIAEIDTTVAFGATAMGTDAFGLVVYCANQVDNVAGIRAELYPGTEDSKFAPKVLSLPDTLTAGVLVTPAGNLAARIIPTGLDSGTGTMVVTIFFYSK
jgi:hypothetical protein